MSFLINSYAFGTAAAYDTDYQATLDFGTTNSYTLPSTTRKTAENALYVALKAESGLWNLLDAFATFYTDGDANFALINGKTRTNNYTAVNSPTFASLTGYTGNGADKYVKGNRAIGTSASGQNYTQNSAHVIVAWTSGGNTTGAYTRSQAVTQTGGTSYSIISQSSANGIALNDGITYGGYTMGASGEVAIITRVGSTEFKLFNNANPTGVTITKTSATLLATIAGVNHLGSGSNGSASTVRFGGYGGGLTDAQAIAYRNAVKTLTGF